MKDRTTGHSHRLARRMSCLLFLIALATTSAEDKPSWNRFRGPSAQGTASIKGLPAQWDEQHIRSTPGIGHSSPVLWNNQIFLTSADEQSGVRFVASYDAKSGQKLWQREFKGSAHKKHQLNSFASPTPTVDKERLYLSWGNPQSIEVIALDHQGKTVWQKSLEGFPAGHGFGTSPVRYNDLLILNIEHQKQSFVVAWDARSGAQRWLVPRDTNLNYATPIVRSTPEQDELITTNWKIGISAIDPASGKPLWNANVFDKSHVESSIGSPIIHNDLVIGVCGWLGHGNEVIAVRKLPGAEAKVAYRIQRGAPLCTTPLVANGILYLWSDNGIVTAADATDGKVHWRKRVGGTFYSSPVAVNGMIINVDTRGNAIVLAGGKTFKQLAKNKLEPSHATPAFSSDTMYIRTFQSLYAISGSK